MMSHVPSRARRATCRAVTAAAVAGLCALTLLAVGCAASAGDSTEPHPSVTVTVTVTGDGSTPGRDCPRGRVCGADAICPRL